MTSPHRKSLTSAYTFELDTFQIQAFDCIDAGESVLVAAPTGSGKTVVAEYAIGLEGLMNFYPYDKSEIELEMEKNMLQCLAQNFSFIKPYACKASDKLINQFKEDMYLGITATCQGFYHPQGRSISHDPYFNSILSDLKAWKIDVEANRSTGGGVDPFDGVDVPPMDNNSPASLPDENDLPF